LLSLNHIAQESHLYPIIDGWNTSYRQDGYDGWATQLAGWIGTGTTRNYFEQAPGLGWYGREWETAANPTEFMDLRSGWLTYERGHFVPLPVPLPIGAYYLIMDGYG